MKKIHYLILGWLIIIMPLITNGKKIVFQDDFVNGFTGWTVIDSSGVTAVWAFSQTPPLNFVNEIGVNPNFTSVANGYAMFDSDGYGDKGIDANQNSELISPAINCSGLNEVILEFEQHYYHYFNEVTSLWVRTEATNFIEFPINKGMPPSTATANPELVKIDLSSIAAGKDSVFIKFKWKADWEWWWLIDDIIVYDPEKFDVAVFNSGKSKKGNILPRQQAGGLSFSNQVANIGKGTVSNVKVNYSIYNSLLDVVYKDSASVDTIIETDTLSFQTNTVFNPPYGDLFSLIIEATITEEDIDTSNNIDTLWLFISDSMYALDNGESNVIQGVGFPAGTGSFGNIFRLYEPDTLTSISFMQGLDKAGDKTSFSIFTWDGDSTPALVYTTPEFTLTSASFLNWDVSPSMKIALDTGEYLVVINQIVNNSNISISADNASDGRLIGSPSWTIYTNFGNPLIRPNFSDPCAGLAVSASVTNVLCKGETTGSVTLTVAGGSPSYTYSWSNGATSKNISSLTAGTYNVTVKDANSCEVPLSKVVSEPSSLMVLLSSFTNASCGIPNGSASISVSGGTSPYTYTWSNNSTTQKITNIYGGNYTVVVKDNNGCADSDTFALDSGSVIYISISNFESIPCYGYGAIGSIGVTATGTTGPFTYKWSTGSTTQTISSLGAGTYVVTVKDAGVCNNYKSFQITEPDSITINLISTDVKCFGDSNGMIQAVVSGGTGSFVYLWSNSQTAGTISDITVGTYTVTVFDMNECTNQKSVVVGEPEKLLISVSIVNETQSGNDGTASVSASGGNGTYTYTWSNGESTDKITGLVKGSYAITVMDGNGCIKTAVAIINKDSAIGITENSNFDILVYPLPAGDQLIIEIKGNRQSIYDMNIFDMLGKKVHDYTASQIIGNKYYLPVSQLNPGVYFIRIYTDEKIAVIKFYKK